MDRVSIVGFSAEFLLNTFFESSLRNRSLSIGIFSSLDSLVMLGVFLGWDFLNDLVFVLLLMLSNFCYLLLLYLPVVAILSICWRVLPSLSFSNGLKEFIRSHLSFFSLDYWWQPEFFSLVLCSEPKGFILKYLNPGLGMFLSSRICANGWRWCCLLWHNDFFLYF